MQPSTQPTTQPTSQPTVIPSMQPSSQPSTQPSSQPTSQPSTQPSKQPSSQPTAQPSSQPSSQPRSAPSMQPSSQPSIQPKPQPTLQPSTQPTAQPSTQPSSQPTIQPSSQPTSQPASVPSMQPSSAPSIQPSLQPVGVPSMQPTMQPSSSPSAMPTTPTSRPSSVPTSVPTLNTINALFITFEGSFKLNGITVNELAWDTQAQTELKEVIHKAGGLRLQDTITLNLVLRRRGLQSSYNRNNATIGYTAVILSNDITNPTEGYKTFAMSLEQSAVSGDFIRLIQASGIRLFANVTTFPYSFAVQPVVITTFNGEVWGKGEADEGLGFFWTVIVTGGSIAICMIIVWVLYYIRMIRQMKRRVTPLILNSDLNSVDDPINIDSPISVGHTIAAKRPPTTNSKTVIKTKHHNSGYHFKKSWNFELNEAMIADDSYDSLGGMESVVGNEMASSEMRISSVEDG